MTGVFAVTIAESVLPPIPMNGVRAYLRELRKRQRISQITFGRHIGLSRRAVIDWEMGRSEDLKGAMLIAAVPFLGGLWEHIEELGAEGNSEERGRQLAKELLESQKIKKPLCDARRELTAAIEAIPDDNVLAAAAALDRLKTNRRKRDGGS